MKFQRTHAVSEIVGMNGSWAKWHV